MRLCDHRRREAVGGTRAQLRVGRSGAHAHGHGKRALIGERARHNERALDAVRARGLMRRGYEPPLELVAR